MTSLLIPLMAAIAVSAPTAVLAHDGHGLFGAAMATAAIRGVSSEVMVTGSR